jgi:hypothetical protein
MAITQRNLNVGAILTGGIKGGNASGPGTIVGIGIFGMRTSIQLDEIGAVVAAVDSSASPVGTGGAITIQFRMLEGSTSGETAALTAAPASVGVLVATLTIPDETPPGTAYTTRNGTIAWSSAVTLASGAVVDMRDASNRVFPIGSMGFAHQSAAAGHANDKILVYGAAREFGAPPA